MKEIATATNKVFIAAGFLPGVILILIGAFTTLWNGDPADVALVPKVLIAVGIGWGFVVAVAALMPSGIWKNLLASLLTFVFFFGLAEAVCSVIAARWRPEVTRTFWIYEDSGRTVQFDPIRGYRLTTTPSHFARVFNGEIEYVGTLKGNSQGFPDRDDFSLLKPKSVKSRYLVFGNSFSAAQFIGTNWPDSVEERHPSFQLLNLSTDGGGLANWWSNFTRFIEADGYEYDGVVFAVFSGDLRRGFTIADHRGFDLMMQSRMNTWDPAQFPKTLEQAKKHLGHLDADILTPQEFSNALRTKSLKVRRAGHIPGHPTQSVLEQLWICNSTYTLATSIWTRFMMQLDRLGWYSRRSRVSHTSRKFAGQNQLIPLEGRELPFSSGQMAMIDEMRSRLQARGARTIVAHIPSRDELIAGGSAAPANEWKREAQDFALALGGEFVDGAEAFSGLSREEILGDWLPVDGHWGQRGSDRFASFFVDYLTSSEPDQTTSHPVTSH